MKKIQFKILILFILTFFYIQNICFSTLNINTNINNEDVSISTSSIILMDTKYNDIIYSKNANTIMYPASTTKILTAIIAVENCELTEVTTVSQNAIDSVPPGYVQSKFIAGEQFTIEELLHLLLIPSANDSAVVIAEHISGSIENFSILMNEKAIEIGALNSNFVNPSGIHDESHISTAYDMALIGKYSLSIDIINEITSKTSYELSNTSLYTSTPRVFNQSNELVKPNSSNYNEYVTGLKTGYTNPAGFCIVSTAKKDNTELVLVLLNSKSSATRFSECNKLFEYGFNNFKYTTISTPETTLLELEILTSSSGFEKVPATTTNNIEVFLKQSNLDTLNYTILLDDNLTLPIYKDDILGNLSYNIDGKEYSTQIIATQTVLDSSLEVIIFIILILFLGLLFLRIIFNKIKSKFKKKKKRKKPKYIKGTRYK